MPKSLSGFLLPSLLMPGPHIYCLSLDYAQIVIHSILNKYLLSLFSVAAPRALGLLLEQCSVGGVLSQLFAQLECVLLLSALGLSCTQSESPGLRESRIGRTFQLYLKNESCSLKKATCVSLGVLESLQHGLHHGNLFANLFGGSGVATQKLHT